MLDDLIKWFKSTVEDVRRTVLETGWFGKPVTGRSNSITIDGLGDRSPSDALGWTRGDEQARPTFLPTHDREAAAKEPKAPDRGIEL